MGPPEQLAKAQAPRALSSGCWSAVSVSFLPLPWHWPLGTLVHTAPGDPASGPAQPTWDSFSGARASAHTTPHQLFWAALAVLEVAVLYQNGKGKPTTFFIQNFSQIYRIIAFICLLYSENYNERCLISNSSIFRMAAINLTPGHKYILCTEHSLYMQPPTIWVGAAGGLMCQVGHRQPIWVTRPWGNHEDQNAWETPGVANCHFPSRASLRQITKIWLWLRMFILSVLRLGR